MMENYWLFQCNPNYYNIVGALNTGFPIKWRVTAHKSRIRLHDKVILWVCGSEAGCYALAEITSRLELTSSYEWEKDFQLDGEEDELKDMIEITILHNLANRPIFKAQILGISDLEDLKAGRQGTNFSATAQQYEALKKLAVVQMVII